MMRVHVTHDDRHTEFFRLPLRSGGDRLVRGFEDRRGRVVDVVCVDGAREWGAIVVHARGAPVVKAAIAAARYGQPGVTGELGDGRVRIQVEAARRHDGAPLVAFERRVTDATDRWRGRPIVISGDELDALDRALAWLCEVRP